MRYLPALLTFLWIASIAFLAGNYFFTTSVSLAFAGMTESAVIFGWMSLCFFAGGFASLAILKSEINEERGL